MNQDSRKAVGVPFYRRIDVLGGLFVLFMGLVIWFNSSDLPMGELSYFGAGFLPQIFSLALTLCGLMLLVFGLIQTHEAAEPLVVAVRGPVAIGASILLFAGLIKGFALGPLQFPQLGLLLVGPLTVFVAGMGTVEARPRELIVLGIVLTAASVLLFADLLSMQLPVFPALLEHALVGSWGQDWPRRMAIVLYVVLAYGLWRAFGLSFAGMKDRPSQENT